jgi:hypothetical protein
MEAAGIYLVLSSIGMPGRFHWGLYLKLSRNLGFVAHAQHPDWSLSSLDWEMEYNQKATLESSVNLILREEFRSAENWWSAIDPSICGIRSL